MPTRPSITSTQARSWTWCSCSCSPLGRLMTMARPSDSESRTCGWRGSTGSSLRFQLSIGTRHSISTPDPGETLDWRAYGDRDRRSRRGRQVNRGAWRRQGARLHLPRLRGHVPLRRPRRTRPSSRSGRRREARGDGLEPQDRLRGGHRAPGRPTRRGQDPQPRGDCRLVQGIRASSGEAGDGEAPTRADRRRQLRRRGPRHRDRRKPRFPSEGLPDGDRGGAS